MNSLLHQIGATIDQGGPIVWVILALSVLLYTRCFSLLLHLRQARRALLQDALMQVHDPRRHLRQVHEELEDTFERQRPTLAAMIAAAPLLGLLGTVTGMIQTFAHLADGGGSSLMGGLADGISEALIATAAGLAVAIPAILLLYAAHRQLQRAVHVIADLETRERQGR